LISYTRDCSPITTGFVREPVSAFRTSASDTTFGGGEIATPRFVAAIMKLTEFLDFFDVRRAPGVARAQLTGWTMTHRRRAEPIRRTHALAMAFALLASLGLGLSAAHAAKVGESAASTSVGSAAVQKNTCPKVQAAELFPAPDPAYQRRYNTIAHALLDDEAGAGDVTPAMYAILDTLIDEAKDSLAPYQAGSPPDQEAAFARDALDRIDCILLRHGFVYPGKGLVQLLSDGLAPTQYDDADALAELQGQRHNVRRTAFIKARGSGPFYVVDCDTASFIFLAIAEVMQYPIHLVDLPTHNFVRWEIASGKSINYETMDGAVTDDNYYRQNWGIPPKFVGKGGVLNSMSKAETFAYHDGTVAIAWSWRGDYQRMVELYQRSLSRDPTRAFSANNLAWFYAAAPKPELRDGKKALKYARHAVHLYPDSDNLDTLACAYAQTGDFKHARATIIKAIALGYVPFESNLADDLTLFKQRKTCNDEKFGVDQQPFRPPQTGNAKSGDDSFSELR
jgi:tetratricopeptide (TPR) repeat protein